MKNNIIKIFGAIIIITILVVVIINCSNKNLSIQTSSDTKLSNKKIGWGIKRSNNHEQPQIGSNNKQLIDENEDIAMGNSSDKYVYLTFDEGYEAGYTSKILDILNANEVKAAFFITGHYLNSQAKLVERMINEGHIVGNHIPTSLMSFI